MLVIDALLHPSAITLTSTPLPDLARGVLSQQFSQATRANETVSKHHDSQMRHIASVAKSSNHAFVCTGSTGISEQGTTHGILLDASTALDSAESTKFARNTLSKKRQNDDTDTYSANDHDESGIDQANKRSLQTKIQDAIDSATVTAALPYVVPLQSVVGSSTSIGNTQKSLIATHVPARAIHNTDNSDDDDDSNSSLPDIDEGSDNE